MSGERDKSLLSELRRRAADPELASDDGAGIRGMEPLPPVEREVVRAAEERFGFSLPPLLADIYCSVANGGLGPGYGSFALHDPPQEGDLVENYEYMTDNDPDDEWRWPRGLLAVFSHGCGMYECIDCRDQSWPVIWHDPHFAVARDVSTSLAPLASTLTERLEAWIRGEDLVEPAGKLLEQRR